MKRENISHKINTTKKCMAKYKISTKKNVEKEPFVCGIIFSQQESAYICYCTDKKGNFIRIDTKKTSAEAEERLNRFLKDGNTQPDEKQKGGFEI